MLYDVLCGRRRPARGDARGPVERAAGHCQSVDLRTQRLLLIPVHDPRRLHWTLVAVDSWQVVREELRLARWAGP